MQKERMKVTYTDDASIAKAAAKKASANIGGMSSGGSMSKPGVPQKIGTVDFEDKNAVVSLLDEYEKQSVGLDHEVNYTVTPDGNVWRTDGDESTVNPSNIPGGLSGSYSYHNHLPGKTHYSFSAQDVSFFISSGQEYSKASDDLYEYTLSRTQKTLDKSHDLVYHRFKEIRMNDVFAMKFSGTIDPDLDDYHETIKILCKELKIDYDRKEKGK